MKRFSEQISIVLNALKQKYGDKFAKKYRVVFADDESVKVHENEIVDVILSPKYYWVKIEELPVKYAFQAREYAEALFDGFIPDGDYSFKAIKKENGFLIFAYNARDIIAKLEQLGLKTRQLHGVYFAQTELADLNLKINDNFALQTRDGKVIKVPSELAQNATNLSKTLQNLNISANSVQLSKFEQFYDGNFTSVFCVLLVLIAIFAVETFYVKSLIDKNEIKKAQIAQNYSLPNTEIQLNTLIRQYNKIDKEQRGLREATKQIYEYFAQNIKSFEISRDNITLSAALNDKSEIDTLKKHFEGRFRVDEFTQNETNVNIKARYE